MAERPHWMVMQRRSAVLLLLLANLLVSPAAARAETVLFACSENCPLTLFEALELELRGHGAFLVARLDPSGFTVAAHEADARRMAALAPAAAVLWIEREAPLRVRVATRSAGLVREAPLSVPLEQVEARTFAAIAGNVVLQALNEPGEPEPVAPITSAAAVVAASETQTHSTPSLPAEEPRESAPKAPATFQRFFLRAGAALGFVYTKSGMPADRPPPRDVVNGALQQVLQTGSPEAGKEYLAAHGYDCNWKQNGAGGFIASDCGVAVSRNGFTFAPGIDLQAGVYITPRVALAAVTRIAPDAGLGTFNHALLGAQIESALMEPLPRGLWLSAGLGFMGGYLQAKPDSAKGTAYANGGMLEAHGLVAIGYRFVPNFGMYATATLRILFPDTMFLIEPNVGVEVRL